MAEGAQRKIRTGEGKPTTFVTVVHATPIPCATTGFASANTMAKPAQRPSGITIGRSETFPKRVRAAIFFTPANAAPAREGTLPIAESAETIASGTNVRRARSVSVKRPSSARPERALPRVGSKMQRAVTAASKVAMTARRTDPRHPRAARATATGTATKKSARPNPPDPRPLWLL